MDSGLGVPIEDSDPVDECDGLEDFDLGTLKPQQFAQCLTALDAVSRICMCAFPLLPPSLSPPSSHYFLIPF